MSRQIALIVSYLPGILEGFITTVWLTVVILAVSTPLALLLALASKTRLRFIVSLYVNFIRAMPALILLYFAFYALPQFGMSLTPDQAALIGLTAVSTAYLSEDFRGGFQSINSGQYEAAAALGLPFWRVVRRITILQAVPAIMPNYITSMMLTVQGTSLASLVAVTELSAATSRAISLTQDAFGFLIVAAILYLALNAVARFGQLMFQQRAAAAWSK
jgi:His/Glu/Gln/Arg/opine family amino acid ABC transporter permease subunit